MGEQVGAGLWGYSSVGRAPALQAGGHEFESRYLHSETHKQSFRMEQIFYLFYIAPWKLHIEEDI